MAKNNINISVGLDIKNLKKGFDDAIKLTQGASKDTGKAADQMATNVVNAFKKIETSSSLKTASRQMFNLVAALENGGTATQKTFRDSVKEAGHLQDRIQDLNALIKVGGPAGPFIAMNNALKVGVGAMNAVQGAMALVGSDSKELQATMVKLQAGMAFAQGLKELEGLKDVFTQLNFVIKSNPLIAGASVGIAIIAAITAMTEVTDGLTKAQRLNNEVTQIGIDKSQEEGGKANALIAILRDETLSREARNNALDTLQQMYPDYLKNITVDTANTKAAEQAYKDLTAAIVQKATVQAAITKLEEIGQRKLNAELNRKKTESEIKAQGFGGDLGMNVSQSKFKDIAKGRRLILDQVDREIEADTKLVTDFIEKQDQKIVAAVLGTKAATSGNTPAPKPEYKSTFSAKSPFTDLQGSQGIKTVNSDLVDLNKNLINVGVSQEAYAKRMKEMATVSVAMGDILKSSLTSGISDMATALGTAIATGEDFGKAIGQSLLSAMANFMKQLGEMFIASGVAKLGFDTAMISIGGAPLAIAAGAALVAASAATTAKLQQSNAPKHFEQGGLVGGTSFSGDRIPALLNSGEAVFTRSQQMNLWRLANSGGGGGGYIASTKIDGRDIYLVYEKAKRDLGRS